MDPFFAVVEYLRSHWKICASSKIERKLDVEYYADRPGYGPVFVKRLRAELSAELKGM